MQRERQTWTFVANPKTYDLLAAVREKNRDVWVINNSDVQLGDFILFWKAKGPEKRRGAVALGEVMSTPFESRNLDNPHWQEDEKAVEMKRRVYVRYVVPRNFPLWEHDVPWLGTIASARAQITATRLPPDEWARIISLVDDPAALDSLRGGKRTE